MPFMPFDLRQFRGANPSQAWLSQLRGQLQGGGRVTAPLPLLDATSSFTERIGAPGQRKSWQDYNARGRSGSYDMSGRGLTAPGTPGIGAMTQRIPAVRSTIAALRPRGQGFIQEVAQDPPMTDRPPQQVYHNPITGRYEPMPSVAAGAPPAPPDRSDVGDGGGFFSGVGDYLTQPGMGQAMIGAGGAMMGAAGQPGATFGGSLGTGLQGFAAERARYGVSEAARQQTAQAATTGMMDRVSTVTAMLDQAQVTNPTERARALEMARATEGFRVITGQLEARLTGAQEATSQELSIEGLMDLLEITDPETRASFTSLPKATALKILQDQYTAQQGGGAAGGVDRQNWDFYQELLKTDPIKAEQFWVSTQGASRMPAAPIQIAAELKKYGDPNWNLGDPYNDAQTAFLAFAENIPQTFRGVAPTPAQQVFDTDQLRVAREWDTGGRSIFDSKISKFDEILEALDESNTVSGAFVGTIMEAGWIPEFVKALTVKDAINTLDTVRSIVFESLRDTLGPQFTEREGDRLVAASYNAYLPEELNRVRMRRLRTELTKTADNKNRMMAHYNEHGTFVGYEEPYVLGAGGSVPMAHLMIEASDYSGIASDTLPGIPNLEEVIAEDIRNFTLAEARALFVDLQDEFESEAVLEMRRQLLEKVD